MWDVDSSELSSPPEFALGWRKPPRSSSCPLPQATQYPHPMTDWCRGIKPWPPCLNSGQLWKAFPVLELPTLPVEAFVVKATQSNFSFSPVLLPLLPLGIKPLAHTNLHLRVYFLKTLIRNNLCSYLALPMAFMYPSFTPLHSLKFFLSAFWNSWSISKNLYMKVWDRQFSFSPLDVRRVISSLLFWGGACNRHPTLIVPGLCLLPHLALPGHENLSSYLPSVTNTVLLEMKIPKLTFVIMLCTPTLR